MVPSVITRTSTAGSSNWRPPSHSQVWLLSPASIGGLSPIPQEAQGGVGRKPPLLPQSPSPV